MTRNSSLALTDVLQFMQLLWRLVHGLERTSRRMTVSHGVTGPQRLVLRIVGLQPGISAGEVASALHVHPSTLTGVFRRLQAQGLLARDPHPTDRRRAVLRLTARGRRLNANRQGTVEAAVARALAGVSRRDQASARKVLSALADAAEN